MLARPGHNICPLPFDELLISRCDARAGASHAREPAGGQPAGRLPWGPAPAPVARAPRAQRRVPSEEVSIERERCWSAPSASQGQPFHVCYADHNHAPFTTRTPSARNNARGNAAALLPTRPGTCSVHDSNLAIDDTITTPARRCAWCASATQRTKPRGADQTPFAPLHDRWFFPQHPVWQSDFSPDQSHHRPSCTTKTAAVRFGPPALQPRGQRHCHGRPTAPCPKHSAPIIAMKAPPRRLVALSPATLPPSIHHGITSIGRAGGGQVRTHRSHHASPLLGLRGRSAVRRSCLSASSLQAPSPV